MADAYDQEMMLGYIEGDLDDAQRGEFERQMASDPRLRMLVEQMMEDRHVLRGGSGIDAPESLMEQVNLRLERSMLLDVGGDEVVGVVGGGRRIGRWVAVSSIAALLVVGVSVAVVVLRGPTLMETMQQQETLALNGEIEGRELAVADEVDVSEHQGRLMKEEQVKRQFGTAEASRADVGERKAETPFDSMATGGGAVSAENLRGESKKQAAASHGLSDEEIYGFSSGSIQGKRAAAPKAGSKQADKSESMEDLWKIDIRSYKDSDVKKESVGGEDGRHEQLFEEIRKVLTVGADGEVKPNAALDIEEEVDWPRLTEQEVAVVEQAVAETKLKVGVGHAGQERIYDATLKVVAADVDAVRGRLVEWARGNQVGIQSMIRSYDDMVASTGEMVMEDEKATRRVVLVLEAGQMGELVKYLDSESDERVVVSSERGWWNEIVSEQRKADHLWMMQGRVELDGETGEMKQDLADWVTADLGKYLQMQVGGEGSMMLYESQRLLVVEIEIGQ